MSPHQKVCAVIDCPRPHRTRGFCQSHYMRAYKRGEIDPLPGLAATSRERFLLKTQQEENGCWRWTGKMDGRYGRCGGPGSNRLAHRAAYMLLVGPIPDGLTIDHLCRNTWCVNPAHLEPVSLVENLKRMHSALGHGGARCKRGHERTPENINERGECRVCHRDRMRAATPRQFIANVDKDACVRGHAFDDGNTYYDRNGWRRCRACHRERERRQCAVRNAAV